MYSITGNQDRLTLILNYWGCYDDLVLHPREISFKECEWPVDGAVTNFQFTTICKQMVHILANNVNYSPFIILWSCIFNFTKNMLVHSLWFSLSMPSAKVSNQISWNVEWPELPLVLRSVRSRPGLQCGCAEPWVNGTTVLNWSSELKGEQRGGLLFVFFPLCAFSYLTVLL